jgi:uncharacterized protein YydD (DUF2326 family)
VSPAFKEKVRSILDCEGLLAVPLEDNASADCGVRLLLRAVLDVRDGGL